jgi:Ni/Fe-hydrogenase subunit HybB-like protein
MRYNFVVAGQVYPNIPLGLPSYLPTLMEVFVISGVIASFLLVYILGDMFLSLKEDKSYHVT